MTNQKPTQKNSWQVATLLESHIIAEDMKSLTFKLEHPLPHKAGQHYSIRLTSEDGYMAERDYSIANPPEQNDLLELGIQFLEQGEVSPYLFEMRPGEQIEVLGPVGGHFIWEAAKNNDPLILIGGGSGMVPLRSMLMHHINNYKKRDVVFLISAKTINHIAYQFELEQLAQKYSDLKIVYTLTRETPPNFKGYTRRIDQQMIQDVCGAYKQKNPEIFVCGPTLFVEATAIALIHEGFDQLNIKTERFGGA